METTPDYGTIRVSLEGPVARVCLNRPERANAFDLRMWEDLPRALAWIGAQRQLRAVLLHGEGRHFTAGIDLEVAEWLLDRVADPARATRGREEVLAFIESAQRAISAIEQVPVPVIAAVHGACIGGGVDLIAACDIRLCTADARFSIKELDLAIVPDVGTLQRLCHVIGYSAVAELSYTAETFDGSRALSLGLVSRVCESQDALMRTASDLARTIAAKSPVTVRGLKRNLLWSRDHDVRDGLAYVAAWNTAMLPGEDLREALAARAEQRAARFAD